MKIALAGATGLVGKVMLQVLEESATPCSELIPVASERSVGKTIRFRGEDISVVSPSTALSMNPSLALFSMGSEASKVWAPRFAERACFVIDNSSAWRQDDTKKLIIPEINAHILSSKDTIIANPNCSTIQMLMALYPLHQAFGIQRVVVSTYQSVTGSGAKAVAQLEGERAHREVSKAYPHPIHNNLIPHCGAFLPNGYTTEEMKLSAETVKILDDDAIQVSATAVRVPVTGGHSESIHVSLQKDFDLREVQSILRHTRGLSLEDVPAENRYPTPQSAQGRNEVFIGRLRRDFTQAKTLNLWVVSDNLRKGAATNAVQIAHHLIQKGLIAS